MEKTQKQDSSKKVVTLVKDVWKQVTVSEGFFVEIAGDEGHRQ